jgi:Arc/MetJ-type ribon-helix-helix transcriptional regulator
METQSVLKKPGRPKKKQLSAPRLNQITVHLPSDLVSALDHELAPLGMRSRSELIREACQMYLDRRKDSDEPLSLTRRMQDFSPQERQKTMAAAAETLSQYYRTDAEIQEWQALDTEDFYDVGE